MYMPEKIFPLVIKSNFSQPYFQKGHQHFLVYKLDGSIDGDHSGLYIPPIIYFEKLEFFIQGKTQRYRLHDFPVKVKIFSYKTEHFFYIKPLRLKIKLIYIVPEEFTGLYIDLRSNKLGYKLIIKPRFTFNYVWHENPTKTFEIWERQGNIKVKSLFDKNLRCIFSATQPLHLVDHEISTTLRNLKLFIADSYGPKKALHIQLENIRNYGKTGIRRKERLYRKYLFHKVQFNCPDKELNKTFILAMYNIRLLRHHQPSLGEGYFAGIPYYPEFFSRDTFLSIPGIVMTSDFENAKYAINVFARYQSLFETETQSKGKIPHEIWLNGEADYYSADSTLLFIYASYYYYKWSNDTDYIRSIFPSLKLAFEYIKKNTRYGTIINYPLGFLKGSTWMDSYNRSESAIEMQALLVKVCRFLAILSTIMKEKELRKECRDLAKTAKNQLTKFWYKGYYADRIKKTKNVDYTITANPLFVLMLLLSNKYSAHKCFQAIEEKELISKMGIRARAKKTRGYSPGHYHKGKIWPVLTGVATLAAFKYKNYLLAMKLLKIFPEYYTRFIPYFSPECIHGNSYTLKLTGTKFVKEKEHFSSFLQLWSSSIFIQAIIEGLFGIDPIPRKNKFDVKPYLPEDWDFMELKNLRIFDKFYDILIKRVEGEIKKEIKDVTERNIKLEYSSSVLHE